MGVTHKTGSYSPFRSPIRLSLHDFREVDANGAVSNIAGNGGILASDTTPIMRNTSGVVAQEISWATGNVDPILCQTSLPEDFDGREDVVLELTVRSGTTNAATFTALTSWDGGTNVSTTVTDGALSATNHVIRATIPASSIPDTAASVAVHLTPATHATDIINLVNARLLYLPKRF